MPEGVHCGYHIDVDGDAPKICFSTCMLMRSTALLTLAEPCARLVTGAILEDAMWM
uniref:Uncharacterized protein n=1 Tax=Anguilla anguilla TaxID=7936 RepID=A0A0E9UVT5_ANGAN